MGQQHTPLPPHAAESGRSHGLGLFAGVPAPFCFQPDMICGLLGPAPPARAARASLRGRELPRLSRALAALPPGARAVIVDGRLDAEGDGFDWLGDLRITCPDTAPHSTAALYRRREE